MLGEKGVLGLNNNNNKQAQDIFNLFTNGQSNGQTRQNQNANNNNNNNNFGSNRNPSSLNVFGGSGSRLQKALPNGSGVFSADFLSNPGQGLTNQAGIGNPGKKKNIYI